MDINTAKEIIYAASLADDTVLLEGPHGIGKSNIVKQFAKENNYHLEELFLSHQEVGDLIGIPFMERGITTWSTPIWLKRMWDAHKDGKHCILFLDELNRAPIDVRQSALQLVLERKIHEHALPVLKGKRTLVVAAINPADEYQVDELDPALLDRFLHVSVEADVNAWLKWARNNNVNQIVTDFISNNPDRMHWTPADNSTGATPRSWAKLGDFLDNCKDCSDEILFQIFKGKVGAEIGAQFFSFFKQYVDIINVEDIENFVSSNMDVSNIEELANKLEVYTNKLESIQKIELCNKFSVKYKTTKDILPFLAFLYSLQVETCISFLKSYKNDDPDGYKKLAEFDNELNDKKLFKRIVTAANKGV